MRFDGDTQSRQVVGTPGFSESEADYTSLALASDGNIIVAYMDYAHDYKASVMSITPDPEGKTQYQWYRNDVAIEKATGPKYTVTDEDL